MKRHEIIDMANLEIAAYVREERFRKKFLNESADSLTFAAIKSDVKMFLKSIGPARKVDFSIAEIQVEIDVNGTLSVWATDKGGKQDEYLN